MELIKAVWDKAKYPVGAAIALLAEHRMDVVHQATVLAADSQGNCNWISLFLGLGC